MRATLRIYKVKVPCPLIRCGRNAYLHAEESVVELYRPAHADTVLGTVSCNHHPEPFVYEYRAEHLHRAVFLETRVSRGRLLDVSDLIVPEMPGPRLSPRQAEVYARVVRGEQDKRIAGALRISESMVRKYIAGAADRLREEARDLPLMSPRRTVLAYHARESGPRLLLVA